jgi:hypothetical protein
MNCCDDWVNCTQGANCPVRATSAFPIPVVTVTADEPTEREIAADAQPSLWERIDPCSAVIWVLFIAVLLVVVAMALQIQWPSITTVHHWLTGLVQSIPVLPVLPSF